MKKPKKPKVWLGRLADLAERSASRGSATVGSEPYPELFRIIILFFNDVPHTNYFVFQINVQETSYEFRIPWDPVQYE